MIDIRICQRCPCGPESMKHVVCRRCKADDDAVTKRKQLCTSANALYRGVDYGAALEYDLLPALLPLGDPAIESGLPAA